MIKNDHQNICKLSQIGHISTSNDILVKFVTTHLCRDETKGIEFPKIDFDFIFNF